ncbi:unnamed protein product [Mytilus edulis]|uniref:Uncharacterized protein n=1 Tax=Mytilus edulis TaxID=6550 RepID=A0A8S3QSU9_MYTED|nr:unnamed protein product [Mytilus edulis]
MVFGGYFEEQDTWKQASINVQNIGEQQQQIKKFLGLARAKEPKRRAGSVTMLERHQNYHPILTTQSEDVILHALITLNVETDVENYSLNKGNAVTAQNKDLIHRGEWLRYLDENMQECFGVLKNGLILSPRRGSAKLLAIIYKSNLLAEKVGCPVVQLSSTFRLHKTHQSQIMTQLKKTAMELEQEQVYEPEDTFIYCAQKGAACFTDALGMGNSVRES